MISTAWAMTAATIQLFVIAVLAVELIAELELTRWQLGALGAVNTGVGAIVAPRLGQLADRLGSSRAMVLLVAMSGVGLVATAAARSYWLLVAASVISGLPQGASNPVTNKVIAEQVPAAQQGSVMGVKQSGVQFAVFLSGAVIPISAATFSWRWAVVGIGIFTIFTALVLLVRQATPAHDQAVSMVVGTAPAPAPARQVPPVPPVEVEVEVTGRGAGLDPGTQRFVNQVAIYAFLLGMSAGGITRFYPLYAHEVLGYSETTAGLSVSVAGIAAIVARIVWAKLVESAIATKPALVVLGIGSAVTVLVMLSAELVGRWLLWPAVIGVAFTLAAWNVVAMLAVIKSVPARLSGRASGTVLMGFLGGLTLSAPLVGWSIDEFDSYWPSWLTLAVLALVGSLVVTTRRRPGGGIAP